MIRIKYMSHELLSHYTDPLTYIAQKMCIKTTFNSRVLNLLLKKRNHLKNECFMYGPYFRI